MVRVTFKGHAASFFQCSFLLINLVIFSGAAAAVALMFVMRSNPTFPAGWGFIAVGIITALSGLLGIFFNGRFGCFGIHLLLYLLSLAGTCTSGIILLVKPSTALSAIQPTIVQSQANQFVMIEGILMVGLFVFQLADVFLMWVMQSCDLVGYSDVANELSTAKEAARRAREEEERVKRVESSQAHQIAIQMKEKYGSKRDPDV